jgi:hypothetical protein
MHDLPVLRVTAKRFDGDLISHGGNSLWASVVSLKMKLDPDSRPSIRKGSLEVSGNEEVQWLSIQLR